MSQIKMYRWYGGKYRMVGTLAHLIPEHEAYYEPFMGSAALLLNHCRSRLEVLNDLDPDLTHFVRTLADREKGQLLTERLCSLWYGRGFFNEAIEHRKNHYKGLDDIEKAVMVYVQITQSFNGTRQSYSRSAYADTERYRRDIRYNIPQAYERLRDVRVLNMDGIDLLSKIAVNRSAFAFVDPPYRKELRGAGADKVYACELPHSQQVRLLKTIRHAECKIILCGYRSGTGTDLYDRYLIPCGYRCYKLADVMKSCQTKEKKDIGHEFIWVNYPLPESAKYVISLREYNSLEQRAG